MTSTFSASDFNKKMHKASLIHALVRDESAVLTYPGWPCLHSAGARGPGQWPGTGTRSSSGSSRLWRASWRWSSRRIPPAPPSHPGPAGRCRCWRPAPRPPPPPAPRRPAAPSSPRRSRSRTPSPAAAPRRAGTRRSSTPSWRSPPPRRPRSRGGWTSAHSSPAAWCSCWWRRTRVCRAAWADWPPPELR